MKKETWYIKTFVSSVPYYIKFDPEKTFGRVSFTLQGLMNNATEYESERHAQAAILSLPDKLEFVSEPFNPNSNEQNSSTVPENSWFRS